MSLPKTVATKSCLLGERLHFQAVVRVELSPSCPHSDCLSPGPGLTGEFLTPWCTPCGAETRNRNRVTEATSSSAVRWEFAHTESRPPSFFLACYGVKSYI